MNKLSIVCVVIRGCVVVRELVVYIMILLEFSKGVFCKVIRVLFCVRIFWCVVNIGCGILYCYCCGFFSGRDFGSLVVFVVNYMGL